MNNKARTPGVVLGLIGGIINIIFGIILLIFIILGASLFDMLKNYIGSYGMGELGNLSDYNDTINSGIQLGMTIVYVFLGLFFIVFLLNFIGSCICRNKRIAGGVLMLVTSLLLMFPAIFSVISSNPSSLSVSGYDIGSGIESTSLIIGIVWLVAEAFSFIGAIICFVPSSSNQYMPYGQPQQPYGQPYGQTPPYGQPYGQQPPYAQPPQPPYQPPYGQQPPQPPKE
jgi:hypothetical protein